MSYIFSAEFPFGMISPKEVKVPTTLGHERFGEWYVFRTEFQWNYEDKEADERHRDLMTCLGSFYAGGSKMFEQAGEPGANIMESLRAMQHLFGKGLLKGTVTGKVWEAKVMWPKTIDFGELCYQTEPIAEINITWHCRELVLNESLYPPLADS